MFNTLIQVSYFILQIFMNKFLLTAAFVISHIAANAQTTDSTGNSPIVVNKASTQTPKPKKDWSKVNLSNRSNDHFMLQFGADTWTGTNDSVSPSGFSRFFNAYVMLDLPFKNNPRFSVGIGAGVGSSNIFFEKTNVDIKAISNKLPFTRVDTVDHFKKFKLTTIFLEAPIELRFVANPERNNKSWKIALGTKIGTLLKAYTKGKTLVNSSGNTVNNYIEKRSDKRFFNGTRLALTARIGYGIFGLYGSYQITGVLKDGAGPNVRPYSIGITLSGL